MQIRELTRSEKIQHEFKKKIEEFKRNSNILKAKIFRQKLSINDDRTIQAHKDAQGALRDYYISNSYLQGQRNMSYTSVFTLVEDPENKKYVYQGMVKDPYCAVGVIETNVPLSEIVASPEGNLAFEQLISRESTKKACESYYEKIGEPFKPTKEGSYMDSFFGKPSFVLGSISMAKNGKFTIGENVSEDIEQILENERKESERMKLMRDKDSVVVEMGDIVFSEPNCWLQQSKNMKFVGVNQEALYYEYSPEKPEKTVDGKYVYVGPLKIGEGKVVNKGSQEPLQFVEPFNIENVAFCTEGKNLIEYFLNQKFYSLNIELGKTFAVGNIKNRTDENGITYLGSLGINDQGDCIVRDEEISETVRAAVNKIKSRGKDNRGKIVSFEGK